MLSILSEVFKVGMVGRALVARQLTLAHMSRAYSYLVTHELSAAYSHLGACKSSPAPKLDAGASAIEFGGMLSKSNGLRAPPWGDELIPWISK